MSRSAVWTCVLVLLLITIAPIARTVGESFVVRDRPGDPARIGLDRYAELFTGRAPAAAESAAAAPAPPGKAAPARSARTATARWRLLGNSVAIAAAAALLALALGVPFAFLVSRTDLPFRGLLGAIYGAPLVLPPLLVAVSWTFLRGYAPNPSSAPAPATAWDGPIGILRAAAMFALGSFPLVVLFTTRALDRIPASLEESARLAAGPRRAVLGVVLPLAAPAILASGLFVFLFALNDFSLVDFLNWVRPLPQQIGVYPFESFTAWSLQQGEGVATALGMPLLVLGIVLLGAIHRLIGRAARTTVTGTFRAAPPIALGRARIPAALGAFAVLALAAGVPVAGLLVKAGGVDAYRRVWALVAPPESSSNELLWTLGHGIAAAAITLPLAFVLAHHAARTGRMWPLALAALPLALPPVFLGAGTLRLLSDPVFSWPLPGGGTRNAFLDTDGPRLGTVVLLVSKYLPFAVAGLWAAFLAIDPRLEEAAASAGVRRTDRALGILAPLAAPAIAAAFVLVFVFSVREIDTTVLLTSASLMRRIYSMVHFERDAQVAALCVLLVALQAVSFAFLALLAPRRAAA